MKYICLGYLEPGKFEGMTEDERNAVLDECFEHNDHLRANGHLVAQVALQPPQTALTLYWKNGKVATTDGPYAETKEQLGGLQILEARDLNHAIQLVSQLPGFKYGLGPIEIRPVDRNADLNANPADTRKESEQRRSQRNSEARLHTQMAIELIPCADTPAQSVPIQGRIGQGRGGGHHRLGRDHRIIVLWILGPAQVECCVRA
jgi:hypothetical protein